MSYEMTKVPPLPRNCNSWVIVSRATGEPMLETWNSALVAKVNSFAYYPVAALQWLQGFNASSDYAN